MAGCGRPTYQELCTSAADLNGRIGILARSAAILLSFGGLLFTGISRKTTDIGSESSQHISAGFQSTFDRSLRNRLSLTCAGTRKLRAATEKRKAKLQQSQHRLWDGS